MSGIPGTEGYNVVTLEDQSKELSNLEYTSYKGLQELQQVLLCPSDDNMCHPVDHNILGNNAFQCIDITKYIVIRNSIIKYDSCKPSLKGKLVKRKSKLQKEDIVLERPEEINSVSLNQLCYLLMLYMLTKYRSSSQTHITSTIIKYVC